MHKIKIVGLPKAQKGVTVSSKSTSCGDGQVYLEGTGCIDIASPMYRQLYESGQIAGKGPDGSIVSPTMKPFVVNSKLTDDQKNELRRKEMQKTAFQNQTTIGPATQQPWYSRALDVATHPGTAIRAYNTMGYVPHNLNAVADYQGGPANVLNSLSPASWLKAGYKAGEQLVKHPIQTPIDLIQGAGNLTAYGINKMDSALPGQTMPQFKSPFGDAGTNQRALSFVENVGEAMPLLELGPLANGLKTTLGKSMESGLLSNTYKVNPWRFKPNPQSFYRQIGKTGLADATESGVIRSADISTFPRPHFVEGKDFTKLYSTGEGATGSRPSVIFETSGINQAGEPFVFPANSTSGYTPWIAGEAEVPLSEGKILQKDWLRGYKKTSTPLVESKKSGLLSKTYKASPSTKIVYQETKPLTNKDFWNNSEISEMISKQKNKSALFDEMYDEIEKLDLPDVQTPNAFMDLRPDYRKRLEQFGDINFKNKFLTPEQQKLLRQNNLDDNTRSILSYKSLDDYAKGKWINPTSGADIDLQRFINNKDIFTNPFFGRNYYEGVMPEGQSSWYIPGGDIINFEKGQLNKNGGEIFKQGGLYKAQEGTEYTGNSVVDYLKTKGYNADKSYRKGLAKKYNIADYDYSGPKNIELLNRLREDENLQETIGAPTNTPIPLDKLMEMMSRQRAVSHAQQKMVDPRDVIARVNLANMNLAPGVTQPSDMLSNRMQYTPAPPSPRANLGTVNAMLNIASMNFNPTSTPNKGFLKNRMQYTPLPTMPDRPVEQGLNPAVVNMMLSTQPPMNQTEIVKIPNNPFGSITGGGSPIKKTQTSVIDMYPEINRTFDTAHQQTPYVDPLHADVNMSPNLVNMITQPATPPPVVKPMTQETSASKSKFSRNIDDLEDYVASNVIGAGVKINRGIDAVNNFIDEGKQNVSNFYTRHFGTNQEDELKSVSHLSTITKPPVKPASNLSVPVIDTTPPIKIDAPIITDWNKNHPDTYHAAVVVDLKRIKLGTRNRGEYPEVESDGYLFGGIDVKGNPRRFVNAKTSKLDPNRFYIGADSEGNVISGLGKDIAGKDIRVMDFRVFKNIKGLATDDKGNLKFHRTDNLKTLGIGPDSWTPYYIDEKGNELGDTGPLSYSQNNQKDLNTYGSVTGGHVIVTSPDFSKQILISGSINDIRTQIENFKKENNYSTINAIQVDNGSAAQNVFKKNKKLTKKDWEAIDGRNRSIGGSGFYLLGRGYKTGGPISSTQPEYKRGGPIVSREGYKQGAPPDGSYYQIPGDTLYNPTPYKIKATSDNGITKTLNPFDETSVQFPGAKYVNEQHYAEGGDVKDPLSNYYNHKMGKGGSPRKPLKSMVNNEKKVKLDYKLKYKID